MGSNYLNLTGVSGTYASAPHIAAYNPSASLDVRYDGIGPWGAAAQWAGVASFGAAGQRSWFTGGFSLGVLRVAWSTDGTASTTQDSSAHGITGGVRYQVRYVLAVAGTVTFYKRDSALGLALTDSTSWTQISTHSPGAFSFFAVTTALLETGSIINGASSVAAATIRATCVLVDGAVVYNVDYTGQPSGAANIIESSSNAATITLHGAATVVDATPPTVTAATINAAGTTLSLTFSESVTGVLAANYGLTGGATLGTAAGSGTAWTFPISPAVQAGQTRTLSYTGTATVDAASNALATFSGASVTNNVPLPVAALGIGLRLAL